MLKDKSKGTLAVIRAIDMSKVKITLYDLIRYAHLTFVGKAKMLEPAFADNILVKVLKTPLKNCCDAAAIVRLEEEPSAAIGRIRSIHPPGHIIIVSSRYEIFDELIESIDILPEIDLNLEQIQQTPTETSTSEDVNYNNISLTTNK